MKRKKRQTADIDVTPLIDVLFMLIIFFVLTTVFVRGSVNVNLPNGSPPPVSDKNPVILTVESGSSLLWAGKAISRDELALLVSQAVAQSDDILIAGDTEARYGDVAEILDLLRSMGLDEVGLAFEEVTQ
ncbi:MAG: biopolymer transporter ExbD [Synergistaceae bacterium]|jgi:biopolymer transport protein ExbD|nr:biopolymer transporter ExbD [Synergistaceae bacterium]